VHLDDIRTILLSERDTGTLTQIPGDLYTSMVSEIKSMQQEVFILEDPFSDEARVLIEKVASVRTTLEELFKIRTDKVVSLAQSQAEGSFIDREELRVLIPSELEMFNRIVEAITQGRRQLIDWRSGQVQPVIMTNPEASDSCESVQEDDNRADMQDLADGADNNSDTPFSYVIVRALSEMEPFMGVDGRTYEVMEGDILTLPMRNAQVLAERNIVINMHPG